MEKYNFSNYDINLACEETGKFLASAGVERREALRIKLTFEEVLLKYQQALGADTAFNVRFIKRMSSIKVEIIVAGESCDVLCEDGEENDVIRGLLAGMGLAPTWAYKNGRNHIIFMTRKKPLSSTVRMGIAIVLAIIAGMVLNLLPDGIRMGANDYLLTPMTDAFKGLISAVSGPLIFLSVLGSICSMGNMETLGKIGSKTIKVILLHMTIIAVLMTALGSLFYRVEMGGSGSSNFTQALDLVYDIIPSNLFEPFVTGNTLQLIFIAIMVGLAMLVLSSRVSAIFSLVEQLSSIVQTIMTVISSMLPALIFILFTGMISTGNLDTILNSWKSLAVIMLLMVLYFIIDLLRIAVVKKVSPMQLWKKTIPTFMAAFTTSSSAAAFTINTRDANQKLGIDQKLVDFAVPLGQVLFMPAYFAVFFGIEAGLAEACNVPITLPWLFIGLITNLLVTFAIPPIPGGAVMGFTVAFTQLGIPLEMTAVAIAIYAIPNFPATAVNVSSWQLTMLDVADSLDMLDRKVLHKDEAKRTKTVKK